MADFETFDFDREEVVRSLTPPPNMRMSESSSVSDSRYGAVALYFFIYFMEIVFKFLF
jgi:hypothetical protein